MVSLDTDALIAACQGAAWKISGWPENIAIHHAKGCVCCHKYINHLLVAQSLRQINLQCIVDVKNAVQSAWPAFINSIEIDADQCVQGQLSNLHVQIDEPKDALHDMKKPYCCEVCLRYFYQKPAHNSLYADKTVYSTVIRGNSDWVCDKR